ncbi:hypothetical protein ACHQM5_021973 [Ranunculus cassubicifolius]
MAKASRRVTQALYHLQSTTPSSNNRALSYLLSSPRSFSSSSTPSNPQSSFSTLRNFFSQTQFTQNLKRIYPNLSPKTSNLSLGSRSLSLKTPNFTKLTQKNGNFKEKLVEKPVTAVRSVVSRYREALGLQVEAFWKRNYLVMVGVVGVGVCMLLWKIMFGIANTFVGLSEGMAKYGFLALSSAMVTFAGLYLRARFTVNPDKVYRIAMRKLNTDAGILEVMGAPLSGTDVRAYVMSGGGITLKNFKPKLGGKRCFLIFPIRGSERKGLVSVEVKKKKGQYDMKLLAVDVPMLSGPDQRFYLIGDEVEYKVGGGLISELRDPIVKAMAAEKEFEALDDKEDEEDEEKELLEAERKHQEELQNLEKE